MLVHGLRRWTSIKPASGSTMDQSHPLYQDIVMYLFHIQKQPFANHAEYIFRMVCAHTHVSRKGKYGTNDISGWK